MRVLAYCDARYQAAVRQMAGPGATMLVSPPLRDEDLAMFAGAFAAADLILFNFHALPGADAWLNTTGDVALSAATVRRVALRRAVIFMVNCNAGGGVLEALKSCRPRAIIGGQGENLGALTMLAGADLLGLWLRRALQWGLPPRAALGLAKTRLRAGLQTASIRDALNFEVLYG
jgi:hypothetical protein